MVNATDLKKIKVIVYDFDGIMTNNKVLVSSDGQESVFCNRSDGLAVRELIKRGINQCIISTETNKVVDARAKKLGIPCIYGVADKKSVLLEYVNKNNIDLQSVAYIGNDINDLEAMRLTGIKIAPKDAADEILAISDIVTNTKGGDGVIYEVFKKYFCVQ